MKRLLLLGAGLCICIFLIYYYAAAHFGDRPAPGPGGRGAGAWAPGDGPAMRMRPPTLALFAGDSPEAACVDRLLREPPPGPRNAPYCCHLLRLYGLGPFRHPHFASGREVVRVLTDRAAAEAFFGEPIFFRTRSGIRYQDGGGGRVPKGENHRDVIIATFAELGLPLSTPMTIEGGAFSLRDLLQDSVDNFDIKQDELPWTAVAYALYMGPAGRWTNRYGESFGFDDLAVALMATPLHDASCGGAHVLYSLTVLKQVDSSTGCLSDPVRPALLQYLRRNVTAAIASQHEEGYWSLDWSITSDEGAEIGHMAHRENQGDRLLMTGHLLEWLELLPVELQPPDRAKVYRRAARWLCATLTEGSRTQASGSVNFCPHIHAVGAVARLIGEAGGSS